MKGRYPFEDISIKTVVLTVIRTDGSTYPKIVTYDEFDKLCKEV